MKRKNRGGVRENGNENETTKPRRKTNIAPCASASWELDNLSSNTRSIDNDHKQEVSRLIFRTEGTCLIQPPCCLQQQQTSEEEPEEESSNWTSWEDNKKRNKEESWHMQSTEKTTSQSVKENTEEEESQLTKGQYLQARERKKEEQEQESWNKTKKEKEKEKKGKKKEAKVACLMQITRRRTVEQWTKEVKQSKEAEEELIALSSLACSFSSLDAHLLASDSTGSHSERNKGWNWWQQKTKLISLMFSRTWLWHFARSYLFFLHRAFFPPLTAELPASLFPARFILLKSKLRWIRLMPTPILNPIKKTQRKKKSCLFVFALCCIPLFLALV